MIETLDTERDANSTRGVVAKLWGLCNILRDDGITFQHYVTELTFLLFLKMLSETGRESMLPKEYRWADLDSREGEDQLTHYKRLLLELGDPQNKEIASHRVRAIFTDAQTSLRKPANLKALTDAIDKLDWFSAREEGLGNLYEGLLEKNAAEKKSGAGQYFTPRPLIDSIVRLMKPRAGEIIQDPAAGTGGFFIAADQYVKNSTDDLYRLTESEQHFQRNDAFVGLELVPDTHRLCLMNLMLHGIEGNVQCGDTLSPDGQSLPRADIVLTNPPFGMKKGGGGSTRNDFSVTAGTNNKQLGFLEHVFRTLKPGGRAAVVIPDNVLYQENLGTRLRQHLMELCDLHTILRLPTGIFYAQSVKTNVLFFVRGKNDRRNTSKVWVYDMRTNVSPYGKTKPLTKSDFSDFENCFGDDPYGKSPSQKRVDRGADSRFRCFSREWIAEHQDKLDISWLKEEGLSGAGQLADPIEIANEVIEGLELALQDLRSVLLQLGEEEADD